VFLSTRGYCDWNLKFILLSALQKIGKRKLVERDRFTQDWPRGKWRHPLCPKSPPSGFRDYKKLLWGTRDYMRQEISRLNYVFLIRDISFSSFET
jgi:hypothetical protein